MRLIPEMRKKTGQTMNESVSPALKTGNTTSPAFFSWLSTYHPEVKEWNDITDEHVQMFQAASPGVPAFIDGELGQTRHQQPAPQMNVRLPNGSSYPTESKGYSVEMIAESIVSEGPSGIMGWDAFLNMPNGAGIWVVYGQDPQNDHLSGPRIILPIENKEAAEHWAREFRGELKRAVKQGSQWTVIGSGSGGGGVPRMRVEDVVDEGSGIGNGPERANPQMQKAVWDLVQKIDRARQTGDASISMLKQQLQGLVHTYPTLGQDPYVIEALSESKTKKGAHGGGNEYDEAPKVSKEFKDLSKRSLKEKDEPKKGTDTKVDPGEGSKLGKKPDEGNVKGFKKVGGDLKDKDKPGKVTKNETLDSALDALLESVPNHMIGFKTPNVLGVFGVPTEEALDNMDSEINGDPCPDCDKTPDAPLYDMPSDGTYGRCNGCGLLFSASHLAVDSVNGNDYCQHCAVTNERRRASTRFDTHASNDGPAYDKLVEPDLS